MSDVAIYGATGLTGRLTVDECLKLGLRPTLCGRNASQLVKLAAAMNLPWRAAPVHDANALDRALTGMHTVMNAAGPFSRTAEQLADACLRVGAHYVDVSGEVLVVERLTTRDRAARQAGITIMPAVGFDVVPTDCLAAHVVRRLPRATMLTSVITQPLFLSRGSLQSLLDNATTGYARCDGRLQFLPLGSSERYFDLGRGPSRCVNISFADLVTSLYTTGVPNAESYIESTWSTEPYLRGARMLRPLLDSPIAKMALTAWGSLLPASIRMPGSGDDGSMIALVEARDREGNCATARMRTPDAYQFTAMAAAAVIHRMVASDLEPGFQTPARVYGADFALALPGVVREDLD